MGIKRGCWIRFWQDWYIIIKGCTRFLLLTILLIANMPVSLAGVRDLRFERVSIEHGLPHSTVICMLQDSKGFIWFGTGNGLCRFDGYSFKIYRRINNAVNQIPHNVVTALAEDKSGNIWIGTREGIAVLEKYSGRFRSYLGTNSSTHNLNGVEIMSIFCDSHNNVWVGTHENGLICYDLSSGNTRHLTQTHDGTPITRVKIIKEEIIGNDTLIYLLTGKGELYFDKKRNKFELSDFCKKHLDLKQWALSFLLEGKKNKVWYSIMGRGLFCFDKTTGKTENFQMGFNKDISHSFSNINHLSEDYNGNIWIATENKGVIVYEPSTRHFTVYKNNPSDVNSLVNNNVFQVLIDRTNIVWIATAKGGVNKVDLNRKQFKVIRFNPDNNNSISDNSVHALFEDNKGKIWVGTNNSNLNCYDPETEKWTRYYNFTQNNDIQRGYIIGSIAADNSNNLWVASWNGIIVRYSLTSAAKNIITRDSKLGIDGWSFRKIVTTPEGRVWIGSYDRGVEVYNPANGQSIKFDPNQLPNRLTSFFKVWTLMCDSKGFVWVGTYVNGLIKLNSQLQVVAQYLYDPTRKNSLDNNTVKCIFEDKNGLIWAGTEGGLNCIDPNSAEIKRYGETDGLCNNSIYGILGDKRGHLWISTDKGLSRFDPQTRHFRNYYLADGLPDDEFNTNAYWYSHRTNQMYFGTPNGLLVFNPDSIKDNATPPKVVITGLTVFDQPVGIGDTINGRVILKTPIEETPQITLTHRDYVFSIEFSALHFASPQNNRYFYKLDGFDSDWRPATAAKRIAYYSNLNPGTYQFYVKATNNDEVLCTEPAMLVIKILPPFWRTWWFRTLMVLTVISLILAWLRKKTKRIEKQKQLLEQQVKNRTAELINANELLAQKQKEILAQSKLIHDNDQQKLQFFTNISHEFRTPLTLILGPVDKLLNTSDPYNAPKARFFLELIQRNALRMLRLINQVLDTSKYEAGQLKLKLIKGDITEYVRPIFESFRYVAESKNITYIYECNPCNITGYFDHDKVEKIVYNLISNAFKHTNKGGCIKCRITIENSNPLTINQDVDNGSYPMAKILISDTGTGIPENLLHKIFERFYQAETVTNNAYSGTGIGLSLTRELVDLHKGFISVESKLGVGSEFTVKLPLNFITGAEYYAEDAKQMEERRLNRSLTQMPLLISEPVAPLSKNTTQDNKPLLLIVEDNFDMRSFIVSGLEQQFRIVECSNGNEGVEAALEWLPDLIISDIMMPGIDGLTLTKKLKSDLRTCHIPIILLTARGSDENRIEGFETGADEYIAKPFSDKLLQTRVYNLMENSRRLREKYSMNAAFEQSAVLSPDELFILKVKELIEQNIDNENFATEQLAECVGMNRTQLYRKLMALTNLSVSDFIRHYRLNRAKQYFEKGGYTVSEVAFKVGFKDPSYFSKCFIKEYGVSPSKFENN